MVTERAEKFETPYATGASPACIRWLRRLGIETTDAKRIIIDIQPGKPVTVYVQRFAQQDLFEMEPPTDLRDLKGIG